MAKPNPKAILKNAASYLGEHPDEIVRAMRAALGLRVGVPLDALRYLVRELAQGSKAPRDVVIEARPPGLRIEATVRAMGTTLRVRLTLFVDQLDIGADQALVTARIADMELEVLDGHDTPVAGLVKSGALDLSKPGNLVAYMPKRPDMMVEAKDDRIVLDLLKLPKLANNGRARRLLAVMTPVLNVASIHTHGDHLDVQLRASPGNIGEAVAAATA